MAVENLLQFRNRLLRGVRRQESLYGTFLFRAQRRPQKLRRLNHSSHLCSERLPINTLYDWQISAKCAGREEHTEKRSNRRELGTSMHNYSIAEHGCDE